MVYSPLGHLRFLVRDVSPTVGKQRWTDAELQEFLDESYREFYWRSGKTVTSSNDGTIVSSNSESSAPWAATAGTIVAIESVDFKTGGGDYVPIAMDSYASVRWMQGTQGIASGLYPYPHVVGCRIGQSGNTYSPAGPQQTDMSIAFYPGGNYTFRVRAVLMTTSPDVNQIGLSQAVPYAAAMIAATVGWDKADVAYLLREAPEWAQIAQQTTRWSTRPNTYQLQDAMAGVT